jgi:prepilin-type N-terminal cleavage/methylation domain-containing protein
MRMSRMNGMIAEASASSMRRRAQHSALLLCSTGRGPFGRGFSFLEVLIALTVFSLLLIPLMSLIISGHKGTTRTVDFTQAEMAAMSTTSYLKTLKYEEVKPSEINLDFIPLPDGVKREIGIEESSLDLPGDRLLAYKIISLKISYGDKDNILAYNMLYTRLGDKP